MNTSFVMNPSTLEYVAVPALQDNYIWIVTDGENAVVVDPGDAAPVNAWLYKSGCRLNAILLTHHHQDHVGGVADLLYQNDVPVYGPVCEAIQSVTHAVKGGNIVRLKTPKLTFSVLNIPGHTRGHIAFFQKENHGEAPHVFCGDTLFACGCGRLFEGTPQQMLASLDILASLPETTYMHCGHEYTLSNIRFALMCDPNNTELQTFQRVAQRLRIHGEPTVPTTIGQEKRINPFLRAGHPAVQRQLAKLLAIQTDDRLTAFTAMREWKNRVH